MSNRFILIVSAEIDLFLIKMNEQKIYDRDVYRLDWRREGEENFEASIKTKKRLSSGNAKFPLFLSS
jgi:hypothetical protein